MIWTWEVNVMKPTSGYMQGWDCVYMGNSWWKALKIARHWKKTTDRTVEVIWR